MTTASLQISPAQQAKADQRDQLKLSAQRLEEQAIQAAQQGDITEAAKAILAGLDCERRMAASGPQVLQLIKPRS